MDPLENGIKITSLEKTQLNHSDVMQILFQKVSKSKNRKINKATVEALKQLNNSKLSKEKVEKFMSQSELGSLGRSKCKRATGLGDPETAVSSVNEHLQSCGNKAVLEFGTSRVNSILTWVTKTPRLGAAIDKCRKLGKEIDLKIKPIWGKFIDEGEMVKMETEVTIENYNSLCQEVRHSYGAILKTLEALREERRVRVDSKDDGTNDKSSMLQLLEDAEEELSGEEEDAALHLEWLKNQKVEIEGEAFEIEQAIEMVRSEMFRFNVALIKAKHCCTIVDTVLQLRNASGNEGVYGHESQIATRLGNTAIGRDSKKFARILNLESDADLLAFVETERTTYVRIKRCVQTWIDRNGAKATTMAKLIELLRINGEVLCAEIVENYQENLLAKNSKEVQMSEK